MQSRHPQTSGGPVPPPGTILVWLEDDPVAAVAVTIDPAGDGEDWRRMAWRAARQFAENVQANIHTNTYDPVVLCSRDPGGTDRIWLVAPVCTVDWRAWELTEDPDD